MAFKNIIISSGHGKFVSGAVGILNEVTEARRVVSELDTLLTGAGVGCVTFNDDTSKTQAENLKTIVDFHNSKARDLDVSVHFNAFQSTDKPMGVEVLYFTEKDLSAKLSAAIAAALKLPDRGAKERKDLYFLKNTAKPAVLIEVCFVDSTADAAAYKANFGAVCRAIADVLSGKTSAAAPSTSAPGKTPIMAKPTASAGQMQQWALNKGARPFFVALADTFYKIGAAVGVDPAAAYCLSAKETGYGKFGGVLDESFHNPCGMKTTDGGGDYDKDAHKRFDNWEQGIQAQIDHMALYAGAAGYPKAAGQTPDPRHFASIRGAAANVEDLGGKWCANTAYGTDIVKMMNELKATAAPPPKTLEDETVDKAIANNIIKNRKHRLGVLNGTISPVPQYIMVAFNNAHAQIEVAKGMR